MPRLSVFPSRHKTKHWASGLIETSPVKIPTSENFLLKSRYFWLLKALIGEVYKTLLFFFFPNAIPYSATTVLPDEVWAQTKTFWWDSKRIIDLFWKVSNSNENDKALLGILS